MSGKLSATKRGSKIFFWSTHDKYSFLSNSYESEFFVKERSYVSVERFVWVIKALVRWRNKDLASQIHLAANREDAKHLIRKYSTSTHHSEASKKDWMDRCVEVMTQGVRAKFEQSEDLGRQLLSTGERQLIYADRYDPFWGIGFLMVEAFDNEDCWGKNKLGEILTEVRKRLRSREEE